MCSDQEFVVQHRALLAAHRRTLAVYLRQQAALGLLAPPGLINGIAEAQGAISEIKSQLRANGAQIEDEVNDDLQEDTATIISPWLHPQERHNRSRMLDRVEVFWIRGVLEQSLYQIARVDMDFEHTPGQVVHPWEGILHQPAQPIQAIPAGKPIITLFDDLLGEMLILGAPGAGKTTMLLELTRDLIARARQNEHYPIPVVFNLSTWPTRRYSLKEWLVAELNQRYSVPRKMALTWVASNTILPLLDGLDEVAAEHRAACVAAINEYRRAANGFVLLVVCSRTMDYEALTVRLHLQGAVVIQPLSKRQIESYLKQVGRPLAAVRAALRDDAALWELMDSPLMLSIVALAYKDTAPAKLRATATLEQRRRQLFDDYIAAMLQRRSKTARYPAQQTCSWLAWLADQLIHHELTIYFIEQMQPDWLPTNQR